MPRQSRPGSAPDRASRASSQGGSDRVTLFDALTCRAAGRYTPGSTIRYSSPWLRPSGLSHPSGSAVLLAPLPLEAFDQLEASATDGFLAQIPLTLIEAGKRAGSVAWIAVEDPSHPWPYPERSRVSSEQWPYGPDFARPQSQPRLQLNLLGDAEGIIDPEIADCLPRSAARKVNSSSPTQGPQVRRLCAGANWIRTFHSAPTRQCFRGFFRETYALTGSFDAPGGNVVFAAVPTPDIGGDVHPATDRHPSALGMKERPLGPASWNMITSGELYRAVLQRQPYAARGLVGFGANLLLSHSDSGRGRTALAALNFYVHADLFMNPTAEMADVVLPVASPFELE
jgi:hypothetical protein